MTSRRPAARFFWASAVVLTLVLPVAADDQRKPGYLSVDAVDILAVLPLAPAKGDARYAADRRIFKETRRLVGSARWNMATDDVTSKPGDMLRHFSCAVGVTLTNENSPALLNLIGRAGTDTGKQTNIAKDFNKRLRPPFIDKGKTCQPVSELKDSYDYPSGHATWGWTWATILAELAPDRASGILARGRAYGESRVVCGAHNASAVDAARLSSTITLNVVRTTAEYAADFKAAKAELDALRTAGTPPSPEGCKAEAALVAMDILHPTRSYPTKALTP